METDLKLMCVIADRGGVVRSIIEGLETAEEMQQFIEEELKMPKKKTMDEGVGYMIMPSDKPGTWKTSKGEQVLFSNMSILYYTLCRHSIFRNIYSVFLQCSC